LNSSFASLSSALAANPLHLLLSAAKQISPCFECLAFVSESLSALWALPTAVLLPWCRLTPQALICAYLC
jgi:hypothetical protein